MAWRRADCVSENNVRQWRASQGRHHLMTARIWRRRARRYAEQAVACPSCASTLMLASSTGGQSAEMRALREVVEAIARRESP